MTPADFDQWVEFNASEPIGDLAKAVQIADLIVAMYASNGGELERGDVLSWWGCAPPSGPDENAEQTIVAGFNSGNTRGHHD